MTTKTSLSMALSQEELFVIMLYLKAEKLPGLELEVFKSLSEEQTAFMMGIAERALVARNFLKPDPEGRLKLEQTIFAIVGACAFPDRSLIVTRTRPEAIEENYFFHTSRNIIVMHTTPVTTIHQFIAVEEKMALMKTILSILNMPSLSKPKYKSGSIQQTVLEEARNAALEKGAEEASMILFQTKLDKKTYYNCLYKA
jgi:hypothetical protein